MKIHAFKVDIDNDTSAPLEEVLAQIKIETSLKERIRRVGQTELRAESIIKHDEGFWLIDFVRIRTNHGPGKVGRDTEIEGFEFDEDEGFGEETAALYDPKSGYILIQYNHFGVRAGAIADYLSAYDESKTNLYTFKPKYDDDIERRLHNQRITRKMIVGLDISKMSAQDRQRGRPLTEAIEYGRNIDGDKIKLEVSVKRESKGGLIRERVNECLTALSGILGQNPEAVTKLEVTGKEDADSITEVLDLVGHRLFVEFNDLKIGNDLRFPRSERWSALERARSDWKQLLK